MQTQSAAQGLAESGLVAVKSVRPIGRANVYCLTTEKNGNFIANGIVVKNCDATRYALMTHFFNKKGVGMTERDAEELEKLYRYR